MFNFDTIIVAPFQQGQKLSGFNKGAGVIYDIMNGKKTNLELDTVPQTYSGKSTDDINDDYQSLFETCKKHDKYVLLGGDHSIGQPSVAASLEKIDPKNLYVIWIDAHGDINTYKESKSKNLHGMPLAGLVGYEKPWVNTKKKLLKTNLLYFGLRDADDFEMRKITKDKIFYTSIIETLIQKINDIIVSNNNAVFHVSWDVDSLDPIYMDSTGCRVPNGLKPIHVVMAINYVKNRMIALDIVEYNSEIGTDESKLTSVCSMNDILTQIMLV